MTLVSDYFTSGIARDFLELMCDRNPLGRGIHRDVYRMRSDRSLVAKFEMANTSFMNVREWTLWNEAPQDIRKWLCPCVDISGSGHVLIMRYAEPIPRSRLPKKVPDFLHDLKQSNWGLYKNRPVAIDYGLNGALGGRASMRLLKVDWY